MNRIQVLFLILTANVLGRNTVIIYPDRITRCGMVGSSWSTLRLASLIFNPFAMLMGQSTMTKIPPETWLLLNGGEQQLLTTTSTATTGSRAFSRSSGGRCPALDHFANEIAGLAQPALSGMIDLDVIGPMAGDLIDRELEFLDGRYHSSALVTPTFIFIPGCQSAPVELEGADRAIISDFTDDIMPSTLPPPEPIKFESSVYSNLFEIYTKTIEDFHGRIKERRHQEDGPLTAGGLVSEFLSSLDASIADSPPDESLIEFLFISMSHVRDEILYGAR